MLTSSYPKRMMRETPSSPNQAPQLVHLIEGVSLPPHCRGTRLLRLASPTRRPWICFACLVVAPHGQRARPHAAQSWRAPQHSNRPAWKALVVGDPTASSCVHDPFFHLCVYSPCPLPIRPSLDPALPPPAMLLSQKGAPGVTCTSADQVWSTHPLLHDVAIGQGGPRCLAVVLGQGFCPLRGGTWCNLH